MISRTDDALIGACPISGNRELIKALDYATCFIGESATRGKAIVSISACKRNVCLVGYVATRGNAR